MLFRWMLIAVLVLGIAGCFGKSQITRELQEPIPRQLMPLSSQEFDPKQNIVQVVERLGDPNSSGASTSMQTLTSETGIRWNPELFTSLKIISGTTMNRHHPSRNIGYKLLPHRSGSLRTFHPYTQYDFWVSRIFPSDPLRKKLAPELTFIDVPKYIQNPENIKGESVAVWHTSSIHHMPRTEDFGDWDYKTGDGVALAMWTGFDVIPHDLWDRTPFLHRPQ